jgi:TolB-like protein
VSRFLPLLPALLLAPIAGAQSPSSGPEAGISAVAVAPAAPVEAPAPAAEAPTALVVTLLPLEANDEARELAPGVTALLVSRLAEFPRVTVSSRADQEAVRTAGVCAEGSCLEAAPGTPGSGKARYVITGRLDGFGSRYVLTTSLMDSESGRALARPRVEVAAKEALPRAAVALADQLLATLVADPTERASSPVPSTSWTPRTGSFVFGLRFNNSLISDLGSFNPGGDVELGFHFHPEWVVFGQVGLTYVTGEAEGRKGGLNVLPSVLGLRHYHNPDGAFRPYWGLGLGIQLSFGEYGIFKQTGPLPTVIGFAGLEFLVAGHLGLQLEASTNIAQATLGLTGGGLGSGLNLDLNAGIAWHF